MFMTRLNKTFVGGIQFAMLYPVFVSLNYNMQLFNVLVKIANILCETLRL